MRKVNMVCLKYIEVFFFFSILFVWMYRQIVRMIKISGFSSCRMSVPVQLFLHTSTPAMIYLGTHTHTDDVCLLTAFYIIQSWNTSFYILMFFFCIIIFSSGLNCHMLPTSNMYIEDPFQQRCDRIYLQPIYSNSSILEHMMQSSRGCEGNNWRICEEHVTNVPRSKMNINSLLKNLGQKDCL